MYSYIISNFRIHVVEKRKIGITFFFILPKRTPSQILAFKVHAFSIYIHKSGRRLKHSSVSFYTIKRLNIKRHVQGKFNFNAISYSLRSFENNIVQVASHSTCTIVLVVLLTTSSSWRMIRNFTKNSLWYSSHFMLNVSVGITQIYAVFEIKFWR